MSNMVEHAKRELDLVLNECTTEEDLKYQQLMNDSILEIVKVFAEQDHSGSSANYSINILEKLLRQSFITPLTGEDDEWNEVGTGVFQNRRESAIFKQADRFNGQAYYLEGKAFSDDGGETWYTNKNSFVTVEFPLFKLPEREKIIVKGKLHE